MSIAILAISNFKGASKPVVNFAFASKLCFCFCICMVASCPSIARLQACQALSLKKTHLFAEGFLGPFGQRQWKDEQLALEIFDEEKQDFPNLKYVSKDSLHAIKRNLVVGLPGKYCVIAV